mgnify:FL=1
MIELKKAEPQDCGAIHAMQVEAFAELLEKYRDTATSPGAEPLERIEARMAQDATDYYLILAEGRQIGAARVQRLPENVCRVSPIFILPAFQGKGYAQAAMEALEEMYPQAAAWRLDTTKEEAKLCHLYEKLGYRRTGQEEVLQPGMTIAYYAKQKRAESGEST